VRHNLYLPRLDTSFLLTSHGLYVLQGIVGGSTLVLLFFSFRRLPLGDATTIIFSSPVFVLIMSFLFLREPCGFFRTMIVSLLLTGVVLISKPPFIFKVRVTHMYNLINCTPSRSVILPNTIDHLVFILNDCTIH